MKEITNIYIRPEFLKPGDKVGIVSPAGAVSRPETVQQAAAQLASWGLQAVVAPHALASSGYYSGSVEERLADMRLMLGDDSIKALLCSYGGYGCMHLLPAVCDDIRCHPKWILGMSDCTALHAAALSSGVMSIHSPQCRHLAERGGDKSSQYLKDLLFGKVPKYNIAAHPLNRAGSATGTLVGGNLSLLAALAGTPYNIITSGCVLFIEDVNEPLYKVERMLQTLRLSGALASLSALVVGSFAGCRENAAFGGTAYDIIANMVSSYGYPVCFGFPAGHADECYPLVVGAAADIKIEAEGVLFSFCL